MINGMMATASQAQYVKPHHDSKNVQLFKSLETALKSGDLATAKSAYQDVAATASKNSGSKNDMAGKNLAAVGQALQSGDISSARKAFAAMQDAVKNHPRQHVSPTLSNPTPANDPDGDGDTSPTVLPSAHLNISA
ncbi:MAG TPA: hypothetical protein VHE55_10840 [Fimbriimonadaceae bacterium]|nr:hypothetical protein [Fimbriimonadaceae bacterium]